MCNQAQQATDFQLSSYSGYALGIKSYISLCIIKCSTIKDYRLQMFTFILLSLRRLNYYRPHSIEKGEGNVFTGICLSTGVCLWRRGGGGGGFAFQGRGFAVGGKGSAFGERGVCIEVRSVFSRQTSSPPSTGGRYASYWNAFLLQSSFSSCHVR